MLRKIIVTLIAISPAAVFAQDAVNYQAFIQNADGSAVSGTVDLQIAVWDDPLATDGINRLYVEDHVGVAVSNGLFSVPLGGGSVLLGTFDADLFAEDDRWLEISVAGEALSPRTRFLAVPYALQARQAESVSGMSGAVMHFALPECPPGWSDFEDARGRALVGLPTGGTQGGTVGTALADLENRQHSHTVTTPTTGTTSSGSHSHSVSTRTTTSDTHNHRWSQWNGSLNDWFSWNSSGSQFTITNWSNGMDQAGAGIYPIAASSSATTTIYTDRDTHSHSVSAFNSNSAGTHNHTVTGSSTTSSNANSNPTLPYVQLRVCIKD